MFTHLEKISDRMLISLIDTLPLICSFVILEDWVTDNFIGLAPEDFFISCHRHLTGISRGVSVLLTIEMPRVSIGLRNHDFVICFDSFSELSLIDASHFLGLTDHEVFSVTYYRTGFSVLGVTDHIISRFH